MYWRPADLEYNEYLCIALGLGWGVIFAAL